MVCHCVCVTVYGVVEWIGWIVSPFRRTFFAIGVTQGFLSVLNQTTSPSFYSQIPTFLSYTSPSVRSLMYQLFYMNPTLGLAPSLHIAPTSHDASLRRLRKNSLNLNSLPVTPR